MKKLFSKNAIWLLIGLCVLVMPNLSSAQSLGEGMDRTGTVGIRSDVERKLFSALNCTCGGCPHESLATCTCGFAHQRREELRHELSLGKSFSALVEAYVAEYGSQALSIPPNQGYNRLLWFVPALGVALGGGIVFGFLRKHREKGDGKDASDASPMNKKEARDAYDDKLDDELRDLDNE